MMNSSVTNSAALLEQPMPTETPDRPNRLFADWRISALLLIGLWMAIYMVGLSSAPLLDDADTVHAEAAREMLQRHDWVTLYVNGVRYLEKAPLMYWSVAVSYKVFGISEWSTRFPLMVGVLAMILATCGLGRWAFGGEGGFSAAMVLATALGPFLFTRFLIPDVLVGLWLTLTFWLFLESLEQTRPSRAVCWGLAAVCALNVLTERADWTGVSGGRDRALPAADGKLAASAPTAAGLEHIGFSCGRRAVAHSGGVTQSGAGPCARIPVVLLRQ